MEKALATLKQMLEEARRNRSWGELCVKIKDGNPYLISRSIQVKCEEFPDYDNQPWK